MTRAPGASGLQADVGAGGLSAHPLEIASSVILPSGMTPKLVVMRCFRRVV